MRISRARRRPTRRYSGMPQPQTRLERLARWKEKRKHRNFNKVIRYQSRKVSADNRPRIKGKFVKIQSVPDLSAMRGAGTPVDSDEEDDAKNREDSRDTIRELGLDRGDHHRLRSPRSSTVSFPQPPCRVFQRFKTTRVFFSTHAFPARVR